MQVQGHRGGHGHSGGHGVEPGVGEATAEPVVDPTARLAERLGSYRLVQRIGEGGMGVVHLALDPHGRAVAIKVLRPSVAHDDDARARLEREVTSLARVRHPRVAPVIDADLYGTRPYVVTRYIAGDALDDYVAARGPLTGSDLLRFGRGLVGALEAIHAVGVVHRDLKPANVLVDDEGEPVVIDFGIAHLADDSRLTATGLVMGTPGYLAPEIIEGAQVTPATDWWGWAATLAYAATGRPPFGRGAMDLVLTRVRAGECDLTGVDPRLEPLLAAALAPSPAGRPPVQTVLAGLERYAAGGFAADVLPRGRRPATPVGATGSPRHTLVMPQAAPPLGYAVAQSAGSPAAYPVRAANPVSAAYPGEPGEGESDEPREWGPGAGDPRIGRPDRTGTFVAFATLLAALAAIAPMLSLLVVAAWSWLARSVDRSVTALVMRRFHAGRRRSDVPVVVALGPVHVIGAGVAAVLALLLPLLVGAAAIFCVALGIAALTSSTPDPTHPAALAAGAAVSVLMGWWGPGGASLRRGSKSIVRGIVPSGLVTDVVVAMLLAGALVCVGWVIARGGHPFWWPLSGPPALFTSWR